MKPLRTNFFRGQICCNGCAAVLGIRQLALSANQRDNLDRIKREFNGRYRINQGDCGE